MTDPRSRWWLRLPDHVDLVEQDDGTYTLDPNPPDLSYEPDSGSVVLERYTDGAVRAAVEVRKDLEDAAVLAAVVAELRRLGYTVIPPVLD